MCGIFSNLTRAFNLFAADSIGQGSTQATTEPTSLGKDQPFWDSLNANVKNLHAVISGHGPYIQYCVR